MKKGLFLFFLFTISYSLAQNNKHQVIVLGIDGLNNYRFDEAYTPHFDYLKQHASWTLHAQANEPLSSSPNWKSIITGTTPEKHLITENGFSRKVYKNNPTCEEEPKKFPTIFTMIKRDNPKAKVGLFEHWGAFWRLVKGDKLNRKFWWEFKPKPSVKRAMAFYKKRNTTLSFIQTFAMTMQGINMDTSSGEYKSRRASRRTFGHSTQNHK
ncbi:MAG: alkaline phosphatase family protein [Chitinophagales bacterium]